MTGVQSIIVNSVAFGPMGSFSNFPAAVEALHASYLYPVYEARRKPSAEAIIDVDHGNPSGAGIEHA